MGLVLQACKIPEPAWMQHNGATYGALPVWAAFAEPLWICYLGGPTSQRGCQGLGSTPSHRL